MTVGRPVARRGAFTLLEVLLAIALISAIMAGLYSLYYRAMQTRELIEDEIDRLSARRVLMDRLTDDLRSAMLHYWLREDPEDPGLLVKQSGLFGSEETIRFVRAKLPSLGVWIDRNMLDEPVPPEADTMVVTYRLVWNEQSELPVGLERIEQDLLAATPSGRPRRTMIGRDVLFLRFRYYEPSGGGGEVGEEPLALAPVEDGFAPHWQGRGLPRAVEVLVSDEMPPEGEDLPLRYDRRVIYLPAGDSPLNALLLGGGGRRRQP
jgi:prepilin-type N-terminal cleavage/methylation domain-containing protein